MWGKPMTSPIAMSDLVPVDWIIDGLKANNSDQVVTQLAGLFATKSGLSRAVIEDTQSRRADLTTFGLGGGIAVIHGTVQGLERPQAVFARLRNPVSFGAADDRAADIVFLLLANEGDEIGLLRSLACIARRMRCVADALRQAMCVEALHVILVGDLHNSESCRFYGADERISA